jgi:hypothetical protein
MTPSFRQEGAQTASYLKIAREAREAKARLRAGPPSSDEAAVSAPLALRRAYREWFDLTVAEADGRDVTQERAQALYQQIVWLRDDTGPMFAGKIYADEFRRFRATTGRCGLCGGLPHTPSTTQGPEAEATGMERT